MSDGKNIRHRFTVPAADEKVNAWIEAQSNLAFSLRLLIKAFILTHGMKDATCLVLTEPVRQRGRPTNKNKQTMENITNSMENLADLNDVNDEDFSDQYEPEIVEEVVRPVREAPKKKQVVQQEMQQETPVVVQERAPSSPEDMAKTEQAKAALAAGKSVDINDL